MIVSDSGFVIATPTKCATTTLEEMCRRHRGGRRHPGLSSFRILDWEQPRRQHRMALPVNGKADGFRRFMTVRNPYTRYMSIYEYLKAPHNYSKWGAAAIQGEEWPGWEKGRVGFNTPPMTFAQFLTYVAEQREAMSTGRWGQRRWAYGFVAGFRSPWVWLDSLTDSMALLGEQGGGADVGLIHIEKLWGVLASIKEEFGLSGLSVKPSIHANKCLTYSGDVWSYYGVAHGCCGPGQGSTMGKGECFCKVKLVKSGVGGVGESGVISMCGTCKLDVWKEAACMGYGSGGKTPP